MRTVGLGDLSDLAATLTGSAATRRRTLSAIKALLTTGFKRRRRAAAAQGRLATVRTPLKIEVQQQVAESDRVVTQMVLRAVHREKHRNVSLATIRIDRMRDGKIAEHWSVADMAGLMKQLT